MHVVFVLAHPEPRSFNATMVKVATEHFRRQGVTTEISDLYRDGFDPVERAEHYPAREDPSFFSALDEQRHAAKSGSIPQDVEREIARLSRADLVIFQFPIWWYGPPSILKGWLDRVFVNGETYSGQMRFERGRFRGKRALCSVTSALGKASFGPDSQGGELDRLLWPLQFSLYYLGFQNLREQVSYEITPRTINADWPQTASPFDAAIEAWKLRLEAIDVSETIPMRVTQ